jgi:hypothetical protein
MRRAHLIFGAVFVAAFLLTGQYMDRFHEHLSGMPDGPRLLYRTRHIFILLAGLLNLGLGAYAFARASPLGRTLQRLGSVLILAASALFVAAFFYEPTLKGLYTPLTHWGTYAVSAGVVLHLLSGAADEKKVGAD